MMVYFNFQHNFLQLPIFFKYKLRKSNTFQFFKFMILTQHIQYNAPNWMYVFQKCSEDNTPGLHFGAGTQNRAPFLQNLGYASA